MSTMVEEPEKPDECKKLGLAAAIASGKSISRSAKENGVPKSTVCRRAQDPAVRIEAEIRRRMLDRAVGSMTSRFRGEELAKFAEIRHFPPLSDTGRSSRKSR